MTRPCTDHTCSYHCQRPECVLAQRDELRERLARQRVTLWAYRDNPGLTTTREPQAAALWEPLGPLV